MDPKYVRIIAVVVVVVVVAGGIGAYYYTKANQSSSCALKSTNPLVIDQAEQISSVDPNVAASTPEWGAVQQIYQPLVMYNQTSYTNFTGVLAKNWTESPDGYHWNFTLWQDVHFSNGDPFNAYVMWYSLYRTLALVGIDQYLLYWNFWYPGVTPYSPSDQINASLANLTNDLNTFNFDSPTPSEIAVMEASNQSFQVLGPYEIELNLGFGYLGPSPYTYLLAEIATPGAVAVDPTVINANGKINGPTNAWMAQHAMGTGPYELTSFNQNLGYTLEPDPNYWAINLSKSEPWNNVLQPAKVGISVVFEGDPAVNVQDLSSRSVASISLGYLGPSVVNQVKGLSCVTVNYNSPVYSGASGSWWVYMNQSQAPFNNISVREAIVHAINYSQIINDAFLGYASEWVGPVAPGHPYYNPDGLKPYQYNLTLAKEEMAQSPWPNGYPGTFNFMYINTGTDFQDAAAIVQSNLAQIGIKVNPVGLTLDTFYADQTIDPNTGECTAQEAPSISGGGPFPIGFDFYASDYIAPDDWTLNDALSSGSANICQSGYYNQTVDNLTYAAAGESNPANLTRDYAAITDAMYYNYTDAWFAVPTFITVYSSTLTGLYPTPMGSTEVANMEWNTVAAT